MPDMIFKKLAELEQVEAIALGGSRAGNHFDEKSDYDVYVYITSTIDEVTRKDMLSPYCSYMEIGNHFWEYEDNCILNSGIDIDILYRDLNSFCNDVENVVVNCVPSNAYTTCMWHNLLNSKILYDKTRRLGNAQKKYNVPYPPALKGAIIERQMQLIDSAMPAYPVQIEKAIKRRDMVSINHRVTEFLASYFDLLFALNEQTHPGEKRLMELCKANCAILPVDFEKNLQLLFTHMFAEQEEQLKCIDDLERIVDNVKKIVLFT